MTASWAVRLLLLMWGMSMVTHGIHGRACGRVNGTCAPRNVSSTGHRLRAARQGDLERMLGQLAHENGVDSRESSAWRVAALYRLPGQRSELLLGVLDEMRFATDRIYSWRRHLPVFLDDERPLLERRGGFWVNRFGGSMDRRVPLGVVEALSVAALFPDTWGADRFAVTDIERTAGSVRVRGVLDRSKGALQSIRRVELVWGPGGLEMIREWRERVQVYQPGAGYELLQRPITEAEARDSLRGPVPGCLLESWVLAPLFRRLPVPLAHELGVSLESMVEFRRGAWILMARLQYGDLTRLVPIVVAMEASRREMQALTAGPFAAMDALGDPRAWAADARARTVWWCIGSLEGRTIEENWAAFEWKSRGRRVEVMGQASSGEHTWYGMSTIRAVFEDGVLQYVECHGQEN